MQTDYSEPSARAPRSHRQVGGVLLEKRPCLFLILLLCLALGRPAFAEDTNVMISKVRQGQNILLIAKFNNCSEATITLTATMKNMTCSVPLPLTVDVVGQKQVVLAVFRPIDPNAPSDCTGRSYWHYGGRLKGSIQPYAYVLPYRSGPFEMIQGPNSGFTHTLRLQDAEAYDWAMPVGTYVYPARPGTVVGFRADCSAGSADLSLIDDCNYILLKHDDGTYGEYLHLRKGGVLVRLGDRVTQGQPMALSGNTGCTTEPHLHFAVFYNLDGTLRRTLPIVFASREGATFKPQEGKFY